MDKYKINYIFNSEKDINDILINVLKKEIKKYIQMKRDEICLFKFLIVLFFSSFNMFK